MSKAIVVGGGAAGMMAAVTAARSGHRVQVIERNHQLGKKIFITGKGRCNLTNYCSDDRLQEAVVRNPKFMYGCFHRFNHRDAMDFFHSLGIQMKTERGGRVFPQSDHSSDVIKALERELARQGVDVVLNERVTSVTKTNSDVFCARSSSGHTYYGDACVLATGGLSYPATGSTGDGYCMAEAMGHSKVSCMPALVPVETLEKWPRDIMGLSLKNVRVTGKRGKKVFFSSVGEMVFTHYGISGPLILSLSSYMGEISGEMTVSIDLKPGLSIEKLCQRIERDFQLYANKDLKNGISDLLPLRIVPVVLREAGLDPHMKVRRVGCADIEKLGKVMKEIKMIPVSYRSYNEAVITRGGISVREIHPSTMESKIVRGLFFAGEIIDVDAVTGGFNLQIAWSTGYVAGRGISGTKREGEQWDFV